MLRLDNTYYTKTIYIVYLVCVIRFRECFWDSKGT